MPSATESRVPSNASTSDNEFELPSNATTSDKSEELNWFVKVMLPVMLKLLPSQLSFGAEDPPSLKVPLSKLNCDPNVVLQFVDSKLPALTLLAFNVPP